MAEELFSIIQTAEHIERLYVKDAIAESDYVAACSKLASQFRVARSLTAKTVPNIDTFMRDYRLSEAALACINRAAASTASSSSSAKQVAETVQRFITAMDAIKLNVVAVDQLYPLISDLPVDIDDKIRQWVSLMSAMKAHEEISVEQARQLMCDLEIAYNKFHKNL